MLMCLAVSLVLICLVGVCGQYLIPIDPREPRSFIQPNENEMMRSRPDVPVYDMHSVYRDACNKSVMGFRNYSSIIER